MFTRFVSITLKPNAGQEFTNALANTVLPILREQRGFRDELLFVTPGGPEVLAVSIWDSKEDADRYARWNYPDILNSLSNLIEGTPKVQTYLLAFSTAHKVELGKMPLQSPNVTPVPGVGGG
jgi:hypothetical protein